MLLRKTKEGEYLIGMMKMMFQMENQMMRFILLLLSNNNISRWKMNTDTVQETIRIEVEELKRKDVVETHMEDV